MTGRRITKSRLGRPRPQKPRKSPPSRGGRIPLLSRHPTPKSPPPRLRLARRRRGSNLTDEVGPPPSSLNKDLAKQPIWGIECHLYRSRRYTGGYDA